MNVLVTGGTGFVGQEILRQLRAAGYPCRILARHRNRRLQAVAARYDAAVHYGTVTDPGSLQGMCEGIEAIIHLVGIISEVGESTFEQIHTQGTRNVLNAAQAAGVDRIVHMSALGTRPNAASRYHQTKWAAEEAVRASGLNYTIFRPSLIYGPQDHFVNLLARMTRFSPVLPVLGAGQARFQPVPVEVVGAAFVRALAEPRSAGQTYEVCGPESLTLPQMLDQILAVLGRKRIKLTVPLPLARCQAALLEWVFPALLHQAPPLTRDQLLMLQEDNLGNPQPANELFGLAPPRFREGIAAYAPGEKTKRVKRVN